MGAGALAPGRVCTEFPKDKEFRAFEMLEKIEFSLKPRRCDTRRQPKVDREVAVIAEDRCYQACLGPITIRYLCPPPRAALAVARHARGVNWRQTLYCRA
jgi:hypothetical protein